jgi:hypothetical protein
MRRSLTPKISGPRRNSEQIAIAARVPDPVVQAADGASEKSAFRSGLGTAAP